MRILSIIFTLLCWINTYSQSRFYTLNGTSDSDYGTVVLQTDDGGYMQIIQTWYAGESVPILVKVDCSGKLEWRKGLTFDVESNVFNMIKAPNNGVVLALGYTQAGTGASRTLLCNIDLTGALVWCKDINIQVPATGSALTLTRSNSILVCGNTETTSSYPKIGVLQFDAYGNLLNQVKIDLPSPCTPTGITELENLDVVVCSNYPSSTLATFIDVGLTVLDASLHVKKSIRFDTYYDDEAYAVAGDDSSNIYLIGRSYFMASQWDGMFLKFNKEAEPISVKYYDAGTAMGEVFRQFKPNGNRQFIVCGDIGAFDERDPVLTKLSHSGMVFFAKKYPYSPFFTNYFFSVDVCVDEGFVVTGDIRPPTIQRDGPIIKTDGGGNEGCFMQPFDLIFHEPLYTVEELKSTTLIWTLSTDDTLPNEPLVPIHNIHVCGGPCTNFIYSQTNLSCSAFCLEFNALTTGATSWYWTFEGGDPATSTLENPGEVCFNQAGEFHVTLTAYNGTDSVKMKKEVTIQSLCEPVFPNIITPNGDGINDFFIIQNLPKLFSLELFNRWGNSVGKFKEGDDPWNGKQHGMVVSEGVYYYVFRDDDTGKEYKGFVQVSF